MPLAILGWVEVRPDWLFEDDPDDPWLGVINIETLVEDDYDAFGCLFGVMNDARFRPLAPDRGVPRSLSAEAARTFQQWEEHALTRNLPSPTWISWAELRALDEEERAVQPDARLHEYVRLPNGALKPLWKAANGPHMSRILPDAVVVVDGLPIFREGQQWEIEGVLYRAETLRRRDALGPRWRRLFRLMEVPAEEYGDDGVRLVVCFEH